MDILALIIFGALVGWIASMIMKTGTGVIGDIVLGIVGAVIGGLLMNLLGQSGVSGFNLYSFVVALIGAVIVIAIGRAFTYRSI